MSPRLQALLAALLSCLAAGLLFSFKWEQGDTLSYTQAIELFWEWDGRGDFLHRLTKPLGLLLPATAYYTLGLPPVWGLYLQQVLAYFLSLWFWWQILAYLGKTEEQCLQGVFLLLGAYPFCFYGLAFLIDGVGWCANLACMYLIARFHARNRLPTRPQAIFMGEALALAIFVKESVLMAGLWLFLHSLTQKYQLRRSRFLVLWRVGINFLAVFGLVTLFTLVLYEQSLFTWFSFAHTDPPRYANPWLALLQQTYRTLDVYWFLVLGGFALAGFRRRDLSDLERSLLLTGVLAWLIFPYAWAYYMDRILFMIAPFWLPWALYALKRLAYPKLILIFGGLLNWLVAYGIYAHEQQGLIFLAAIMFMVLLSLSAWWRHRNFLPQA